jgi:[acyl-carrier-protein] S-malonyltransferase
MAQASESFASLLKETTFARPLFPVVPNVSGQPSSDPDELKDLLARQMTSPVLWTSTVESLAAAGADVFAECWPKAYLGPLIRKTLGPSAKAQVLSAAQ